MQARCHQSMLPYPSSLFVIRDLQRCHCWLLHPSVYLFWYGRDSISAASDSLLDVHLLLNTWPLFWILLTIFERLHDYFLAIISTIINISRNSWPFFGILSAILGYIEDCNLEDFFGIIFWSIFCWTENEQLFDIPLILSEMIINRYIDLNSVNWL